MSESLDNFVRDAFQEHDGGDAPTVVTGAPVRDSKAPALDTLPGHVVGEFIARGGMGAVYRAKQMALGREVAVKVMTAQAESAEMAERFRREALVLGRLEHPNIVPIHDLGTDADGQLFYTMKLVKGRTLQHILNDLRLEHPEALREHRLPALLTIFCKVCDAIGFAHSQGIIHRDLKPENVMVGEFGEVLVMDWGLAKIQDYGTRRQGDAESPDADISLSHRLMVSPSQTVAGAVMGTPQYMSPEQAWGQIDELDACSDIFSLGGILYAILTLRPPVEGTTLDEVLDKVRTGAITAPTAFGAVTASKGVQAKKGVVLEAKKITPLPHIAGGRVPAALSAVAMKALRVEKADRYQSVADLSADIEKYQGGFATSAEQAGAWKQLKLLMLRHKAVTASLAAMVVLSAGFVIQVMSSERKARHHAEIATLNEKRANDHAAESRRSLARAQIALADAAAASLDAAAMRRALDACPEELRDDSWRYLDSRVDSSFCELDKKHGPIFRAIFTRGANGGECLLLQESGTKILVFDLVKRAVTRTIETGVRRRMTGSLSLDGREIAVASGDPLEVKIFDVATGAEKFRYSDPTVKNGELTGLTLSADNSRISFSLKAASHPNYLHSVDRATKAVRWSMKNVMMSKASPDRTLLGVSIGNTIHILREDSGERVCAMEPSRAFIWDIAFSQDSTLVAAGDHHGFVSVWNAASGERRQRFRVTNGRVNGVAFTRDGRLVTLAQLTADESSQRVIQVWNPDNLVAVETHFATAAYTYALSINPENGTICAPGRVTKFWRTPVHEQVVAIHAGNSCFSVLFFGGRFLLTSGAGKYFEFWDMEKQPPVVLNLMPRSTNSGVVNAACDQGFFTNFPLKKVVRARLDASGQPKVEQGPWNMVGHAIATDKTGTEVIVADNPVLMRYVADKPDPLLKCRLDGVVRWKHVAYADGDTKLVSAGSRERTAGEETDVLAFWDRETGRLLQRIDVPTVITALATSPDGRVVACGGSDKTVRFFAANDFRLERTMRAHDRTVTAIAWHPTKPVIATASDDVALKLWDSRDGTLIGHTLGIGRAILAVSFDAKGDRVAIGTADERALVFETERLLAAHRLTAPSPKKP
jgi:serine/threonine protein kinase/WD40 repeat protein